MKRGDVKHGRVTANKPDSKKTFKALSAEFMSNAKIRGLSEWTIRTYQYQINYFTDFAGEELLCKDINLELMEAYLCYLKETKHKYLSNYRVDFLFHLIVWMKKSSTKNGAQLSEKMKTGGIPKTS